ncbi:class I SAM-dependent methyltransferase [Glycomyces mayteni]|uniref:Class I SAM-dependent methyltransferase n=1 Tax=Glycomyces mayteni TaxID=543887 RepID=A0ABW2DHJ6_9ACTN
MTIAYDPPALDGETLDALLYDHLSEWGPSDQFYLDLVMAAESVLDVGCGTGTILRRARAEGHAGRRVGLDPDPAMLGQAQESDAAEWVRAPASAAAWDAEFDLAIMSGNAFQCLLDDAETVASLTAVRRALTDGGRFVFDTRNPAVKAWRTWTSAEPYRFTDPLGEPMSVVQEAGEPDGEGVVRLDAYFSASYWDEPLKASCGLRFPAPEHLDRLLKAAGLAVEERFGSFTGAAFDPAASGSLITVATPLGRNGLRPRAGAGGGAGEVPSRRSNHPRHP